MPRLETGIDIIEIARVAGAVEHWGCHFLERVYTPREVALCDGRAECLAVHFAAKEAAMKTLGLGMFSLKWRDIEVSYDRRGRPLLRLHGSAKRRAATLGLTVFAVSLSHSRDYGVASVVATGAGPPSRRQIRIE